MCLFTSKKECSQYAVDMIGNLKESETIHQPLIILVEGRAAAGKTSFSEIIKENFDTQIIHMDDFFLPMELRTTKRLNECGGNIHYERFIKEVLPNLRNRTPFTYNIYSCHDDKIIGQREILNADIWVVEGCYGSHDKFGSYADLKFFCNISRELQLKRLQKRNPNNIERFKTTWIPMEELYFAGIDLSDFRILTLDMP